MDILHIIPVNASYIIPLAEALYRKDKANKHIFMVTVPFQTVLKRNVRLLQIRDLQFMPIFKRLKKRSRNRHILKCCKSADHIVWHSFRTNSGYCPFLLFKHRSLLKKSTWIPAEGEIGNYMTVPGKLLNRFSEKVNRYVQANIARIGVPVCTYEQVVHKNNILKPEVVELPYALSTVQMDALSYAKNERKSIKKEKLILQMGLSSQRGNNHMQMIRLLRGMADIDRMVIVIPFHFALAGAVTGAGTQVYKKQIMSEASKLSCSVVYRSREATKESIIRSLNQVDIVLLGNDMTGQLDVILLMLATGKRIFLQETSPLYQYLRDNGAEVYTWDVLSGLSEVSDVYHLPAASYPTQLIEEFAEERVVEKWANWAHSLG